jgi:large subunit ribosomal protein L22
MESGYSEVRAVSKYIRMSPRKVRLVVDLVRGMNVMDALAVLRHVTKAAAGPVAKVLRSAAANAEENLGLSQSDMYIAEITADGGPTLKRFRAGARGRAKPRLRRSTHISVVLREVSGE